MLTVALSVLANLDLHGVAPSHRARCAPGYTGKRVLDVIGAGLALLLLAPLMALIALVLLVVQGHPVIFEQQRPGFQGKPFTIYKFRTMTNARDSRGNLLPDGPRLTRVGRWLRKTSLDELPELWNVLRGEMSLVGPRPLLMEYLDYYTPEQARRHTVKPGITGWAQINGRNSISWAQKFELDLWYVTHRSLRLDLKILFQTIGTVISGQGVTQGGADTVHYYGHQSEMVRE
ncbi:MAG: sugar transferase [Anaerolineae bacterium]|nr:sugar transferase [Anaerolineae bacterium]